MINLYKNTTVSPVNILAKKSASTAYTLDLTNSETNEFVSIFLLENSTDKFTRLLVDMVENDLPKGLYTYKLFNNGTQVHEGYCTVHEPAVQPITYNQQTTTTIVYEQ